MGKFKNMLIDYNGNHFTMYVLIKSLCYESYLNNTSLYKKREKKCFILKQPETHRKFQKKRIYGTVL